jgi:hypothetical protein
MDGQVQRRLVAALVVTTLTACSSTTLSENQCKANDWYTVGYADGSSGYDASRLLQHHHTCVEHGVTPDRAPYTAGWDAGIAQYCTPENGFDLGESGASYNRICPAGFEREFHAAYSDGHTLYIARSELYEVESAIEQRSARIQQMKVEMQYAVDALIAPETPTTDRVFLLERTKSLAEEQGRLEAEIERLTVEAAVKRARVDTVRQGLAYAY